MESIDLNSADDTTLFTDEEHVELDTIDFEFEQTNNIRGIYRQLTVFNGNHCYQTIRNKHSQKMKYRVDISFLSPRPIRQRNNRTNPASQEGKELHQVKISGT